MPGSDSIEILSTRRLDHLPLVSACMRYLEMDQIIDELVASHKLNENKASEVLLTIPGRRKGECEQYRGFSLIAPYVYKIDTAEERQ